jgi:RNA polymerase sigma-70 factor, ECF subfamily
MDLNDDQLGALLKCCALGDSAALKILFDTLSGYFNAIAFRILKSRDLSNDAIQEAFVQIWQNAGRYESDKASPLTWMTSIVRYRALDRLARERKHHRGLMAENVDQMGANDECVELDNISGDADPERDTHDHRIKGHLAGCMKGLSEQIQQCIQLAYLEGYSREEIAEHLQTRVNTVKSWLHRGSERLKLCLEAKVGGLHDIL